MPKRFLTDGEIKLAQSIFGDSINYAAVRVYPRGFAFLNAIGDMSFRGNIYLPDSYLHDFSLAPLLWQRLFIHEMVHVWQVQNGVLNLLIAAGHELVKHKFKYANAYLFELKSGKDLLEYGVEGQPAIIEEYFLRKHRATQMDRRRIDGTPLDRCLNKGDDTQVLLEGVLKNFLENPSYPRQKRFLSPSERFLSPLVE